LLISVDKKTFQFKKQCEINVRDKYTKRNVFQFTTAIKITLGYLALYKIKTETLYLQIYNSIKVYPCDITLFTRKVQEIRYRGEPVVDVNISRTKKKRETNVAALNREGSVHE